MLCNKMGLKEISELFLAITFSTKHHLRNVKLDNNNI